MTLTALRKELYFKAYVSSDCGKEAARKLGVSEDTFNKNKYKQLVNPFTPLVTLYKKWMRHPQRIKGDANCGLIVWYTENCGIATDAMKTHFKPRFCHGPIASPYISREQSILILKTRLQFIYTLKTDSLYES
jgi:hypothetical protein